MNENSNNKVIDMTEGAIAPKLIKFSIPLILGDFLQQIYNTTDSIIVGRYVGKEALAAVGQSAYAVNALLGLFVGISLGATVCVSRAFGAKDSKLMSTAIDTILKLTAICSVTFTVLGLVLVPVFMRTMDVTADAYNDTKTYLLIYFAGISAQIFYNMLAAVLRAVGNSKGPLNVLIVTTISNVFLDLAFVICLRMGVAGAALATIIAQYISAIILYNMVKECPAFETPLIRKQPMNGHIVKNTLLIGLPFGLQRSITSFSNTICMSFVNYFGSAATAAYGIYNKLDAIIFNTMFDIGSALTTFCAQNLGACKPERLRRGRYIALGISSAITVCYAVFVIIFRNQLISLFNTDKEVMYYGSLVIMQNIPVITVSNIFNVLSGEIRARNHSIHAMIIGLASFVAARQIYLHVLWPYYKSFLFVVTGFPVCWSLAGAVTIIYFFVNDKKWRKEEAY